jgi:hypothetical protein
MVGRSAGDELTTGDNNTGIGTYALHQLDANEDDNTAVGYNCGANVDGGSQNTLIGSGAATNIAAATNQIVIGYGATGGGNNVATIGNASLTDVYAGQSKQAAVHTVGIQFPASQTASADANRLDDYEEGTWTPAVTLAMNSASYADREGHYCKIGNMVYATGWIHLNGGTADTSTMRLDLPFTAKNVSYGYVATGSCTVFEGAEQSADVAFVVNDNGADGYTVIRQATNTSGYVGTYFGNAGRISYTAVYQV